MLPKHLVSGLVVAITIVWMVNFFAPLFGSANLRSTMIDTIFMGTVGTLLGFEAAKANRIRKRVTSKDTDRDNDQDGTT